MSDQPAPVMVFLTRRPEQPGRDGLFRCENMKCQLKPIIVGRGRGKGIPLERPIIPLVMSYSVNGVACQLENVRLCCECMECAQGSFQIEVVPKWREKS